MRKSETLHGRMTFILIRILNKQGSNGPGYGSVTGSRKHDNEQRGYIYCWEYIDKL
jgi:hypothetical protein